MPVTLKAVKVSMGSWRHPDDPRHVPGLGFNTHADRNLREDIKNTGGSWFNVAHNTTSGKGRNPDGRKTRGHLNRRDGHTHTRHLTNPAEHTGVKHHGTGEVWFDTGPAALSSKSNGRKMAAAMIAKIPLPLSRHIAVTYRFQE